MRLLGLKICHDLNSETRVFGSLLGQRRGSFDPVVFYNAWRGNPQGSDQFRIMSDATVVPVDVGWRPNPNSDRSMMSKISSLARIHASVPGLVARAKRLSPDVVYSSQQRWDCYVASRIADKLGVPQIVHLHYVPGPWLGRHVQERLRTCDLVISVSDFIRELAIRHGVPAERVRTVRNTMLVDDRVDPETRGRVRSALSIPEDAIVFGNVSRLSPGKGHSDFLEAFATAAATNESAYLVIAGDGEIRAEVEREAHALGLGKRIQCLGQRRDVPDLLSAFDAFLHPSRMDPAPLAVLEASAAGLPVLAYREGGVCDFVAHGETGLLTEPGSVVGLTESIRRVLENPAGAATMGAAAKKRIGRLFRPEDAGGEFARLLESIAANSSARLR